MANENDLLRWARSARSAGVDDRLVELKRPLGIVLDEDANGNVYVETVAARGNAARTGMVSFASPSQKQENEYSGLIEEQCCVSVIGRSGVGCGGEERPGILGRSE